MLALECWRDGFALRLVHFALGDDDPVAEHAGQELARVPGFLKVVRPGVQDLDEGGRGRHLDDGRDVQKATQEDEAVVGHRAGEPGERDELRLLEQLLGDARAESLLRTWQVAERSGEVADGVVAQLGEPEHAPEQSAGEGEICDAVGREQDASENDCRPYQGEDYDERRRPKVGLPCHCCGVKKWGYGMGLRCGIVLRRGLLLYTGNKQLKF